MHLHDRGMHLQCLPLPLPQKRTFLLTGLLLPLRKILKFPTHVQRKKGHKNSFPPRNQISDGRKNGRVKNTVFGPEATVRDYDCFTICQHVVLCELGISFFIADVLYCTISHIPTIKSQSYKPPLLLCLCLGFIVCRHGDLAYFSHFPRPHTSLFATYVASKASKL